MKSLFVLMAVLALPCAAQTTFKCADVNRRITYSNIACEKQGLKEVGPVADRTTTVSGPPVKPPPARANDRKADDAKEKSAPAIKPLNPIIQKALEK